MQQPSGCRQTASGLEKNPVPGMREGMLGIGGAPHNKGTGSRDQDSMHGMRTGERDGQMMEFFMAMVPPTVTQQEHKVTMANGKPVFYDPPEVKAAKQKLMAHLAKHRPQERYETGIRLTTWWCFPGGGKHRDGEYRTTKPDTDNLQKMLKDCMTECGFWKDDALVASELAEKFWADIPGIFIRIEEL